MSSDTNSHVVPEPLPARRPLTVYDLASRIASDWNERGYELSGSDVMALHRELQNAIVMEFGGKR